MIECQLRLFAALIGAISGIFIIHWAFVFVAIAIVIISLALGYDKKGWE